MQFLNFSPVINFMLGGGEGEGGTIKVTAGGAVGASASTDQGTVIVGNTAAGGAVGASAGTIKSDATIASVAATGAEASATGEGQTSPTTQQQPKKEEPKEEQPEEGQSQGGVLQALKKGAEYVGRGIAGAVGAGAGAVKGTLQGMYSGITENQGVINKFTGLIGGAVSGAVKGTAQGAVDGFNLDGDGMVNANYGKGPVSTDKYADRKGPEETQPKQEETQQKGESNSKDTSKKAFLMAAIAVLFFLSPALGLLLAAVAFATQKPDEKGKGGDAQTPQEPGPNQQQSQAMEELAAKNAELAAKLDKMTQPQMNEQTPQTHTQLAPAAQTGPAATAPTAEPTPKNTTVAIGTDAAMAAALAQAPAAAASLNASVVGPAQAAKAGESASPTAGAADATAIAATKAEAAAAAK